MPLGDFAEPGTTPRPLAIGRATRLGFGVLLGFFSISNLVSYTELAGSDFPLNTYWLAVGLAWWFSSDLFVVGLAASGAVGRRSRFSQRWWR